MPNALMNDDAAAMYATRYTGPRPDRPVVNGRAVVTAEELADFRRLFGADKTLRDLLNADRALVRPGTPSAVDPRACLLYTSPSPRDLSTSRMPSSA